MLKYIREQNCTILIVLMLIITGCNGGKMEEPKVRYTSIDSIPSSAWQDLSTKKIYFGHQSVGYNIMAGVRDIAATIPDIQFQILETTEPGKFSAGVFAHSKIGKNVDPTSKVDDFKMVLDGGIGEKADVAFMKFCYVDIDGKTDVQAFFDAYKTKIQDLQNQYPKLKFLHLTVPLKTTRENWKTWLKQLLGKDHIWEFEENIKRNQLNALIRKEYGNHPGFLDIAEIEATAPDGSLTTFTHQGIAYQTLHESYTDDGGHLNETGRKRVAEKLLLVLVNTR